MQANGRQVRKIEVPSSPFNGDFISHFIINIYDFIHDSYYKTDKKKYNELNERLDKVLKIKEYKNQRAYLYALMNELNSY